MTQEQRDELRALCKSATPGEWHSNIPDTSYDPARHTIRVYDSAVLVSPRICRLKDARFISAAHNALPGLLDENERLEAELERVTKERDEYKSAWMQQNGLIK